MTATEIVDAFIAETHGECLPKPYREKMIAMVETRTAELKSEIVSWRGERDDWREAAAQSERDLTIERQRREEAEACLRTILSADDDFRASLGPNFEGDPLTAACEEARAYFRKYDSPTDREEERGG